MTLANFIISDDKFYGFKVSGHSNYNDEGSDIVCSAISSSVNMVLNYFDEIFKLKFSYNEDNETISFESLEKENLELSSNLILGLYIELEIIVEQYPKNLKVTTTEV